jgi:hypothetical protein
LQRRCLHVRRSRHLYDYGEPKTRSARRTVDLFPETVRLLDLIQPLRVTPEMPVFTNLIGRPIEPQAFCYHWYETQTGVSYATLRRHYGEWMPMEGESELRRFAALDPTLFPSEEAKLSPTEKRLGGQFPKKPRRASGFEMIPRGFEPAPLGSDASTKTPLTLEDSSINPSIAPSSPIPEKSHKNPHRNEKPATVAGVQTASRAGENVDVSGSANGRNGPGHSTRRPRRKPQRS